MRGVTIFLLSCVLAVPAAAQSTVHVVDQSALDPLEQADAGFVQAERARLQAHFDEVLAELHAADVSRLTEEQRARRSVHLARLAVYRDRGVFPRRYGGPREPVPEFRDVHGTRCAMGELLYLSGEAALVDEVATTANSATIAELSADPRLTRWLDDNGLTVAEAGRVQPAYVQAPAGCLCSPGFTSEGAEGLWLGRAMGDGTASTGGFAGYDVSVELTERVGGIDERLAGQVVVATARYAETDGDTVLVRFDSALVSAYPVNEADETVACSVEVSASWGQWTTCRADRRISLDAAVAAMLVQPGACYASLEAEDERLTKACSHSSCQAESSYDLGAFTLGLSALGLLVMRRRRPVLRSSGCAR